MKRLLRPKGDQNGVFTQSGQEADKQTIGQLLLLCDKQMFKGQLGNFFEKAVPFMASYIFSIARVDPKYRMMF